MTSQEKTYSRYCDGLRAQKGRAELAVTDALPCPHCHSGCIFQSEDRLFAHATVEHASILASIDPDLARSQLRDGSLRLKQAEHSSEAITGSASTPDITTSSIKAKGCQYLSRKRPNDSNSHATIPRGKALASGHTEIYDPNFPRNIVYPERTRAQPKNPRLYDHSYGSKRAQSPPITPQPSSEWSMESNRSEFQCPPGLLLQPDSRPISQEQLALEVKSIYASLTMVENKCIRVDRSQAAALQDVSNPDSRPAKDHWQVLIALHRTLLHEHHDFFLASQHPSASPALRRLAAKYSMPARMWKHGILSFLELLRRRLPESIDHMIAFIYLAYQMMALLYETVPAFENTWIECLGDLGRYRMSIEDDEIRDCETWAAVTQCSHDKAVDRNPIGRLYHHLAILARPNALQQMYYYARSLTCVRPFASARDSILTLLDPVLGRSDASYSHAPPIDTSFIQAHGALVEKNSTEFEDARFEFLAQLDEHIGRVTAKWKDQGVYVAVTNIAGLFDYGNTLRQILVLRGEQTHWPMTPAQSEEGSRSLMHTAISKLRGLWSNPGPGYFSNLCQPFHWRPFFDTCRHISPKAFTAIIALSRLPSAQAARPHISTTGIPITNTFAGALAWIISCFRDGRTVSALLYWVVYGCWVLAALLALGFTASSIAQRDRLRYVVIVILMGGLVFTALVASSVSNVDEMWEHIKTWMPMATVLVTGALPMAFNRVE